MLTVTSSYSTTATAGVKLYPRVKLSKYLEAIFYSVDVLVFLASFTISSFIKFGSLRMWTDIGYLGFISLSIVLWVLLTYFRNVFNFFKYQRIESFIRENVIVFALQIAITFVYVVIVKFDDVSRLFLFYFYGIALLGIMAFRFYIYMALKSYRKKGYNYKNVLFIGHDNNSLRLKEVLQNDITYGYRVLGFLDEQLPQNTEGILGSIEMLDDILLNNVVHELYISVHEDISYDMEKIIALCEKNMVRIKLIPELDRFIGVRQVILSYYDELPVLLFRPEPLESAWNQLVKRAFDVIFSLVVLVGVFSWLFPIVAIGIKLTSKGPIFFKQKRSGENNRVFTIFKFRTMHVNKDSDRVQATKSDKRIYKFGAFLRKTNIDEFPQFINVLIGDMSVIGPRPHMLAHTEQYSELINNYLVRHFLKPGISGWAQVNGFRGETRKVEDMESRVKYDIYYMENWSLLLDLKIIWLTVYNMIRGEEKAF